MEVRRDESASTKPARGTPRSDRSFQNLGDARSLVAELSRDEGEAIDRTLAMMTYNPSIGRVLEKGGVGKFQDFAVKHLIPWLSSSRDRESFEACLLKSIAALQKKIRTGDGQELSFGQAQKPVNVFLKVYCDWANRPLPLSPNVLRDWLHVPLDSVLMKSLRKDFRADFEAKIASVYRQQGRMPSKLDLKQMNREMYVAWQQWFRTICPNRPVLLDVIWAKGRKKKGGK